MPSTVMRLTGIEDTPPVFGAAAPADFWESLHRAGLGINVRWLVLPHTTVGSPGHLEVYVFARGQGGCAAPDPFELRALLALGFPSHRFEPVTAVDELAFATAPFGEWAWSLELAPIAPSRSGADRPGFMRNRSGDLEQPAFFDFEPGMAKPEQALFLLSSCSVATVLDWVLTPDSTNHGSQDEGCGLANDVAFECQVFWSGSAGTPPGILGAGVARAFGAREASFVEVRRTPIVEALETSVVGRDPQLPARLVTHCRIPSLVPSPETLAVIAPGLRPRQMSRLPQSPLPLDGAIVGRTCDGRLARLSVADRLRHVWMIGQTGTGKSTLLLNRILDDLDEGHGLAVLDPHGDLVTDVLSRMPASRRDDLVLVDVTDGRRVPPSLNPLSSSDVLTAHARVGQIVEFIVSLWPREMSGPMFEQAVTHGLLVLAANFEEPGTLADLPRLFTDNEFRAGVLRNPLLKGRADQSLDWWANCYAKLSDFHKSEQILYYIAKFNMFLTDPVLRAVLGNSRSSIDFRGLMDSRGVLLCNLSRSGANPLATTMLTGVFMQAALNAALSRADTPAHERSPFFVYCDEFQRLVGPSTGVMLSEVRKYGLGLVLAHQFIDQLPADALAAVLGNVGTKLVFRVGATDAQRIVGYQPSLKVDDLIRLPNYCLFAELLVGGVPSVPFTVFTPPPPPAPLSTL